MAKGRKRKTGYKRRGGLRLLYLLLSFFLILAAIITSVAVFFRVDKISVTGNTRYSEELILSLADITHRANLFLLPRHAIAQNLQENLPYVRAVELQNQLPNGLTIALTECIPRAALQADSSYWLIDSSGKVLEQVDESLASTYTQVVGLTPLEPKVGEPVRVAEDSNARLTALCALLSALEQQGAAQNLAWVDMSRPADIEMHYLGRFNVRLPLYTEDKATALGSEAYSIKMESLVKIVERLDETDRGIIDLGEDKGNFRPR